MKTVYYWLPLLLSIPLGIVSGLLVPYIQRWIDSRGQVKGVAKRDRMRKEYRQAMSYARHPDLFTHYLIRGLLSITIYSGGAIVSILYYVALGPASVFYVNNSLPKAFYYVPPIMAYPLFLMILFVIIFFSVGIVSNWKRVATVYGRVRRFKTYANTIPADLRDLELETHVPDYGQVDDNV
jgi:hypothetical protein